METNTTRISDTDRDNAVAALTEHVSTGRLDIAEFDRRAALTYGATTRGDLDALFADLPAAVPSFTKSDSTNYEATQAGPNSREWSTWAAVGVLCVTIWGITSIATGTFLYPWPIWVFGPWGAILAFQRMIGTSGSWGCPGTRRTLRD